MLHYNAGRERFDRKGKQRKALEDYEAITGFEPTHQEALDSGELN